MSVNYVIHKSLPVNFEVKVVTTLLHCDRAFSVRLDECIENHLRLSKAMTLSSFKMTAGQFSTLIRSQHLTHYTCPSVKIICERITK